MAADPPFRRAPRSPHPSGEKRYRCVECGGRFPASQVYDDDGEVICEECFHESTQEETGLHVRAFTFVLTLLTLVAMPRLVLDGREHSLSWWSSRFFPLEPGRHRVRMYVQHLFGPGGTKRIEVQVRPQRARSIDYSYYVWWLPASLSVR